MKEVLATIEKDFGKGAVINMGQGVFGPIEWISTGALTLDMALGGGIPRGRIVEIIGPESTGKSTLSLQIIAEAQAKGLGTCVFIDTEHAIDPVYAAALSVDMQSLLVAQPSNAEEALEIVDRLAQTGEVSVIIVDSVAGLVSAAELAGQMGDAHIAQIARLMNQALRKLTGTLGKTNTTCIFTNQLRSKIGGYGSNETTTGGNGLKYFSSVRLDLRRIEQIKNGTDVIGSRIKAKVIKNKCAIPFRQGEFEIVFGEGISREGCILDVAVDRGQVAKKGTYFMDVASGENLGQGREKSKQYLKDHPELALSYYNSALGR